VPIFSGPDKVEAAMSLSMPKARMPEEAAQLQQLIRTLRRAAQEISQKLGGAAEVA
jgi:DNA-binding IclR family transcriptional regulator